MVFPVKMYKLLLQAYTFTQWTPNLFTVFRQRTKYFKLLSSLRINIIYRWAGKGSGG